MQIKFMVLGAFALALQASAFSRHSTPEGNCQKCHPDSEDTKEAGVNCYESQVSFERDPSSPIPEESAMPVDHKCASPTGFQFNYQCGSSYDNNFVNQAAIGYQCDHYKQRCCGVTPPEGNCPKCHPDSLDTKEAGVHCYASEDSFLTDPSSPISEESAMPVDHKCASPGFQFNYQCGSSYDNNFVNQAAIGDQCDHYKQRCCSGI